MLAAPNRLRRSDDIRRTLRDGARSSRRTVVVHHLAAAHPGTEDPARVAFVVSRAVGNAVTRNTVTRRLRHLTRERLSDLGPGSLLVIRATPRAATATSAELGRDLDACLRRLGDRRGRSEPVSGRST